MIRYMNWRLRCLLGDHIPDRIMRWWYWRTLDKRHR